MASDGTDLIDEVSRRLRDPNNTRHGRTLVRDVLTQCSRILNLQQRSVTATASFTPPAGRTIYATTEVAADVARITSVDQENRDLIHVDWRELTHANPRWYRTIGRRYEMFARIGGNVFAIVPALAVPQATTVTYVTVPADVVDGATAIDLPNEQEPALLDMAELVLSVKAKRLGGIAAIRDRLTILLASDKRRAA